MRLDALLEGHLPGCKSQLETAAGHWPGWPFNRHRVVWASSGEAKDRLHPLPDTLQRWIILDRTIGLAFAELRPKSAVSPFTFDASSMESVIARLLSDFDNGKMTRRKLVQSLALVATGAPVFCRLGCDRGTTFAATDHRIHRSHLVGDRALGHGDGTLGAGEARPRAA